MSSIKTRVRTVVGVGVIAALVVAGLAFAQSNNGSGNSGSQQTAPQGAPTGQPPGPPPGGPPGVGIAFGGPQQNGELTYAEFHTQKDGTAHVSRIDAGKIDSVSDSEITITENDGNQVTVPVDSNTKVLAGPGKDLNVSDLNAGQEVNVAHSDDNAADAIMVPPTKAELQKQLKNMPKPPAGARTFQYRSQNGQSGSTQGFNMPVPPPPGVQGSQSSQVPQG